MTNILCLTFNHAKQSVSSKQNAVRLLNKTVSKKLKRKFSAKEINNQKNIKKQHNMSNKCKNKINKKYLS